MGEKEDKRLYEIGSRISKLIRLHGLTNKVKDEVKILQTEQLELLKAGDKKKDGITIDDILDKLDDHELVRLMVLKRNIEKHVREKVEAETKRERFEDPRDKKMMGETYPDG